MRNRFIVTYDVSDPKRLHKTAKKMEGFGDRLQYSVFVCDLSKKELVLLKAALMEIINEKEDRVLIIDAGPASGRGGKTLTALGRQASPPTREVLVA